MDMAPIEVRRIGPGDAELAREVNLAFAEVFSQHQYYLGNPPSADWTTHLLANPGIYVIAAMIGNKVIGAAVCYEFDKLEREAREVYIYDIGVLPDFRRHGVATALILEARRIAGRRNVRVLYIQAEGDDDEAIEFHASVGRRKTLASFDIEPLTGD